MRKKTRILIILLGGTILTYVTNYFGLKTFIQDTELIPGSPSPWLLYRLKPNQSASLITSERNYENAINSNCTHKESSLFPKKFHYTVLKNFLRGDHVVSCLDPFVTYTTHGDYRYLDNLVPLVERWKGPISIALYVPLRDLYETLQRIFFLRECTSSLVAEWVTFHLFAEAKYFTEDPFDVWEGLTTGANKTLLCQNIPSFSEDIITSRKKSKLLYPVNFARNLARREARTHYVLASDIELYPSPNFIPQFFQMLNSQKPFFKSLTNPYVFVLPIFEIEDGYNLPNSRSELVDYLTTNISVTFHKYVCEECHKVPKYEEWLEVNRNAREDKMDVFHTAKRDVHFQMWEPIFVSTNTIPFYDERLTWEGLRDKMTHSYILCLLNYDFMILNNAFLIHRPGIKKKKHNWDKPTFTIRRQMRLINKSLAEIEQKYGKREDCKFG